ncbi:hypothetical protein [Microbacterium sp. CH12i]|uniref:hypothetical protein n=1 Tax=Microbacterium sp. CH12i TaxID=1479651 RepID=UPI000A3EE6AE|nr:hypothetical protein [Microbacterium sp. CH12i]
MNRFNSRRCRAPSATAGGVFENGGAVVDGNLVTARAWPDNGTWMKAFLEVLQAA